jgi:hypothetical protein
MPKSTFSAFTDSPQIILSLARANLNEYAQVRGAELGISMPTIPDTAFYDYSPGPLMDTWRFEMFGIDGRLSLASLDVLSCSMPFWVAVSGQSGDLEGLNKQVRAFGDALGRLCQDEAARNEEFVDLTRVTMSPPMPSSMVQANWYGLSCGLCVLITTLEARE